jgi:hypothetical protein
MWTEFEKHKSGSQALTGDGNDQSRLAGLSAKRMMMDEVKA